jgi:hypothetical protein
MVNISRRYFKPYQTRPTHCPPFYPLPVDHLQVLAGAAHLSPRGKKKNE